MEHFTSNSTVESNNTLYNMTLCNCEERRLLGGPMLLSPAALLAFRCIKVILFAIGFPISLFLNTFVIVLVAKVKKLRQTSFYLALQIIIVDLLITLILFPTTSANVIAGGWVFGAAGCPTTGFFLFTLRNMRNFLMFVFVTDRLLTVFAPFWYYKGKNRKTIVIPLSVAAWVFAVVYGLIPMPFLLDCHAYNKIAGGCIVSKGCKHPKACDAYKNTSIVLSNFIGGFIPLVMYIILYCKARQLKKKVPKLVLSTVTVDNPIDGLLKQSCPISTQENRQQKPVLSSSSGVSDSLSSSTRLAEKRRKRDKTANITFAILFIALIGVSFPSTCFFIVGTSAFSAQKIRPPEAFVILQIIFRTLFNFLVVIDPIAIMRNRDVSIALKDCYKQLKFRIRGEAKPIHTTFIPKQTEKANSEGDCSSISEQEDNNLKLSYAGVLQQKNIPRVCNDLQSGETELTDGKQSIPVEILRSKLP